jgi:uncharacterized protein (DUF952 family)
MVNTSIRTVEQPMAAAVPTGCGRDADGMRHDARVIFHIADRDRWHRSVIDGEYTASTIGLELAEQGFIHLSTEHQLVGVIDRFYRGVSGLVLLHVDETKLTAPLVYEQLDGADEPFPHLYGALDIDAVVAVTDPFPG